MASCPVDKWHQNIYNIVHFFFLFKSIPDFFVFVFVNAKAEIHLLSINTRNHIKLDWQHTTLIWILHSFGIILPMQRIACSRCWLPIINRWTINWNSPHNAAIWVNMHRKFQGIRTHSNNSKVKFLPNKLKMSLSIRTLDRTRYKQLEFAFRPMSLRNNDLVVRRIWLR